MEIKGTSGKTFKPAELASRFDIPKDEIVSFLNSIRLYPKGTAIIREGDTDKTLYLLRHGTVTVYKQSTPDKREHIAYIEAVNFFGEMSLITGERRSATVEAHSKEVMVYAVGRQDLSLILANPRWGEMLITRLVNDLASTNEQLSYSYQSIAKLKKEKDVLEDQISEYHEDHNQHLRDVASVFRSITAFQSIIQDEAIVGSRGWAYLQALNDLTMLLIRNYLTEVAGIKVKSDTDMLRLCIEELREKIPESVYLHLLESLSE